jgi:hypothetical protein
MNTTDKNRILLALKRARPALVRAHLADGEPKEIPLGNHRSRWSRVLTILDDVAWVRLELLDARGRTVGPELANDGAAGELEDLPDGKGPATRELALVRLVIQAQDIAVQRHTEAIKPMFEAMRTVIRDVTDQVTMWRREALKQAQMTDSFAERLERALAARAAGDDDSAAGELGELVKLLPLVQSLLAPPRPPPRPPRPPRPPSSPPSGSNGAAPP